MPDKRRLHRPLFDPFCVKGDECYDCSNITKTGNDSSTITDEDVQVTIQISLDVFALQSSPPHRYFSY